MQNILGKDLTYLTCILRRNVQEMSGQKSKWVACRGTCFVILINAFGVYNYKGVLWSLLIKMSTCVCTMQYYAHMHATTETCMQEDLIRAIMKKH